MKVDLTAGRGLMQAQVVEHGILATSDLEGIVNNLFHACGAIPHPKDISPTMREDFTKTTLANNVADLVLFDPPFIIHAPPKESFKTRGLFDRFGYYRNRDEMATTLKAGFAEIARILAPDGLAIFKWGSGSIPLEKVRPHFGRLVVDKVIEKESFRVFAGTKKPKTTYYVFLRHDCPHVVSPSPDGCLDCTPGSPDIWRPFDNLGTKP